MSVAQSVEQFSPQGRSNKPRPFPAESIPDQSQQAAKEALMAKLNKLLRVFTHEGAKAQGASRPRGS